MTEYCVDIFKNGKRFKCVDTFCDYESAITYIAQNPLSSTTEEYCIGIPYYDNEGWLVDIAYLYPPEFIEDVEKNKKRRKTMKKCIIICNTKDGYCLQPKECKSIAEAIRYANDLGLAYRIFVNGKLIKSGWSPN